MKHRPASLGIADWWAKWAKLAVAVSLWPGRTWCMRKPPRRLTQAATAGPIRRDGHIITRVTEMSEKSIPNIRFQIPLFAAAFLVPPLRAQDNAKTADRHMN